MPKTMELSQAMSSRLCHDLASAVGTISNCVTLLTNSNKAISIKAKALVDIESEKLVYSVKLFRSAYGNSEGETKLSLVGISKLLQDFFILSDVKMNFHFEEGMIYLDSCIAKAAMSLAIIASTNINSTGTMDLYIRKDVDHPVELLSDGVDINLKEEVMQILNGDVKNPITVFNCREHYINKLCAKKGYKLSTLKKNGFIKYDVRKA